MSTKPPAKRGANELHGLMRNDADAQGSREQAEARDGFDEMLQQLSVVIGIDDVPFCTGLLKQILWVCQNPDGKFDDARFGFAISWLQADKPRSRAEAIDKVHDLVTNVLTLEFAKRLWFARTPQEIDVAERTYNKLARTRIAQRQSLEPDRTGNAPNLTVISVNDGSQAIVGIPQATREPRSDNPTPPTAEKGVAPSASRPNTQKTLMPPAEDGTATGARRRKESDGQ